MSVASALALKLGVDESVVEQILKSANAQASGGPVDIIGFARCLNAGCDRYDEDREVSMVVTQSSRDAEELPITITTTSHFHLDNDADMHCPSCGEPCALLPEKRRMIPRLI